MSVCLLINVSLIDLLEKKIVLNMISSSILLFFVLIVSESEKENNFGFFNVGKNSQNMSIETSKYFHKIESAFLMEKVDSKDETNYIPVANILEHTRTIRDVKEYKAYKKRLATVSISDGDYLEIKNRSFNTIFVDMNPLEKNPEKTYTINFKTDYGFEITTRSFHYSKELDRWEVGAAKVNNSMRLAIYISLGIVAVLVVGIVLKTVM
ncbi:hypothetical protein NGRA_2537 [Nosema granulosis]|uniref:Uncharacterized protein n=1 Tax=Nosema granulosis TaxID=83296 RepID=A0A9P6GZN9_9MICR|nr:hypothetical protein NGRA_2537 [Nosema granulosis]